MDRIELIEKLKRIDENAYFSGVVKPGTRAAMIIVGASALLLCDLSHKGATKDVDVLQAERNIRDIIFADRDFNDQCSAFSQCLPYHFKDRLIKIDIETFVLDVFTPSLEDLVVMKFYRWEAPDKQDLTASEVLEQLDWKKLNHLIHAPDEAAASRIADPENDREFQNLRFNYAEYEREHRK